MVNKLCDALLAHSEGIKLSVALTGGVLVYLWGPWAAPMAGTEDVQINEFSPT